MGKINSKKTKKLSKEEIRRIRVQKRKRVVAAQKIAIGTVALAAVAGVACLVTFNVPSIRAGLQVSKAEKMVEKEQYEEAITHYKEALTFKSDNPVTYQSMAKVYLQMNDYEDAGEILQQGIEATGDETIKESYITVLLNDAVEDMNDDSHSWETLSTVMTVLDKQVDNAKAYEILDAFYNRFVGVSNESGVNELLMDEEHFDDYIGALDAMLSIYEKQPNEELKVRIQKYAFLDNEVVNIPVDKLEHYSNTLNRVVEDTGCEDEMDWIGALNKAMEVHDFFTPMLREFEAENFKAARDFIVSDEYIAIRDAFIDGEMQYWENTTYQVVSDIGVSFKLDEGKRIFSFMEEEPSEAKSGFLKVWGFRWVDNGHLRTGISYVPVHEGTNPYPYKEYEIMYWWATAKNIELAESTYAKMNYRFETRIYTTEGMVTEVINDWGGTYEYKDTYK